MTTFRHRRAPCSVPRFFAALVSINTVYNYSHMLKLNNPPPHTSITSRHLPFGVALATVANARKFLLPLGAGKAAAGFPSPATDHIDQRLDLSEYLVLH